MPARRILVHGVTGAGKSTLAEQIGAVTGLPWHSVDDEIGWLPGWVERPREEQRALAQEIAAREEWVLDTAYGHWREVVMPRVDLIVALDYPRWLSFGRLVRRTFLRVWRREAICNGNVESLRAALSRDSILWWHWQSFDHKRVQVRQWRRDPAAPPVLRLTSPRQVPALLRGFVARRT
ncbi:AAA family ATPase [Pseudactinotalea suaedae]